VPALLELVELEGQLLPGACAYLDIREDVGIGNERERLLYRSVGRDSDLRALADEAGRLADDGHATGRETIQMEAAGRIDGDRAIELRDTQAGTLDRYSRRVDDASGEGGGALSGRDHRQGESQKRRNGAQRDGAA